MLSFYFAPHRFEPDNIMTAAVADVKTKEILYQKHFGITYDIWQKHQYKEVLEPLGLTPVEFGATDVAELSALFLKTDRIICLDQEATESFLTAFKIGHAALFDLSEYFKYSRTRADLPVSEDPVSLRTMTNYCGIKGTLCTAARRAVAMAGVYERLEITDKESEVMTTLMQDLESVRLSEKDPYLAELITCREETEELIGLKRELLRIFSEIKIENTKIKEQLRAELLADEMSDEERTLIENKIRQEVTDRLNSENEELKKTLELTRLQLKRTEEELGYYKQRKGSSEENPNRIK